MNEESEVSLSLFLYMEKKEEHMRAAKKKAGRRRYLKRQERLEGECA